VVRSCHELTTELAPTNPAIVTNPSRALANTSGLAVNLPVSRAATLGGTEEAPVDGAASGTNVAVLRLRLGSRAFPSEALVHPARPTPNSVQAASATTLTIQNLHPRPPMPTLKIKFSSVGQWQLDLLRMPCRHSDNPARCT
jgi:hypothetical protein